MAMSINCFKDELDRAKWEYTNEKAMINQFIDKIIVDKGGKLQLRSQLVNQFIIPTTEMKVGIYTEDHGTKSGKLQDDDYQYLEIG